MMGFNLVDPYRRSPSIEGANTRPRLPPFTVDTAAEKARLAEDAWNARDPAHVALAYTTESRWRNRSEFFQGREAIEAFLTSNGTANWTTG
jgi:uncharacterized protein